MREILSESRYSIRDIIDAGVAVMGFSHNTDFRRGVTAVVAQLVIPEVEDEEIAQWVMDMALVAAAAE